MRPPLGETPRQHTSVVSVFLNFRKVGTFSAYIERSKAKSVSASEELRP